MGQVQRASKIGIFYFSLNPGTDRQRILLPNEREGYVRVQEVIAADLSDALDEGEPAEDEMVMNTHFLEPEESGNGS